MPELWVRAQVLTDVSLAGLVTPTTEHPPDLVLLASSLCDPGVNSWIPEYENPVFVRLPLALYV